MTDIKDLLGKAIGDEPPFDLDRDEIFRAGRQRVRRRRTLAAGSVVAAVVVAAVGAATLTNLVSLDPEPVPPAVGDSQHAPPGPDLPLPPKSESQKPPVGVRLRPQHAQLLTERLFESGYVSATDVVPWPEPGHGDETPAFRVEGGAYRYGSDLALPDREGVLQVVVDFVGPGIGTSCGDISEPYDSCAEVSYGGVVTAQAIAESAGERRNMVAAVLPDGTRVFATVSNFSRRFADAGKEPSGGKPVLDMDELTKLIVKSGFSVH